jgi:trimethylguanosine synthase
MKTTKCPFDKKLQHYWNLLEGYEQKFRFDEEGLYSFDTYSSSSKMAELISCDSVIDGCCGVGGMTIGLAKANKKVIAVDINPAKIKMAKHNISMCGLQDNVDFILGDIRQVFKGLKGDAYYFDPPWGGLEYSKKNKIVFDDFGINIEPLIEEILSLNKQILCKFPLNFDFDEIEKLKINFSVKEIIKKQSKTLLLH